METCPNNLLAAIERPLTREQALEIYAQGPEAVVLALMVLSAQAVQGGSDTATASPHTPPSAVPVYQKPTSRKRRKKMGGKPGHVGHRRPRPEDITRRVSHPPLQACPHCGSRVCRSTRQRKRYVEDIPDVEPEVTEHTIPLSWCPQCKRQVSPVVHDAMPNATFGHRLVVLTAWLHYGLGTTLSQIEALLGCYVHFAVSEGGLIQAWTRLGQLLTAWYEEIGEAVKRSSVLFADETGWRVSGVTHWLWCFTTSHAGQRPMNRDASSYFVRPEGARQLSATGPTKKITIGDGWQIV